MQAPTDNLYKFLSIAGMLCFVFFFFDLNKRSDELESKIDTLTIQQAEFLAALEGLTESSNQIKKDIDVLISRSPTIEELVDAQDKLDIFREKIQSKFAELKIVNAKLNTNIDLVKGYFDKLKRLTRFYSWLQSISLVVSVAGVILWYFRTQKYMDLNDKQSVNSTAT
ncbi:hypothetical protein MKS85_27530 [Pseudomonas sp. JL2]|uniref:hypothetical protein n=1 Tax=Pseudomonas sp. JL2 TaxID=2919942 RepID=UPI00285B0861|nr:hypothetical protein [Pseudomonas sp. JL2]MDR8389266.1 hypothetical protein [Pseudomonas sp. JL2]